MPPSAMSIMASKYRSLLIIAESMYVSQKKAVKLLRGEKRLQRLLDEGRIRYDKPFGSTNTMWRYNLADVIKNVKVDHRLSEIDPELIFSGL